MTFVSIDYFSSRHPLRKLATKVAFRARKRMYAHFIQNMPISADTRILDVGVTPDQNLADSNYFELLYPYKDRITATSIEDASFLEQLYPGLTFIQTSGQRLPFEDNAFDITFCSAVLEHVGDYDSQRRFVAELLRVSRRFYITTPNRQFPIELHTLLPLIHWLPQSLHQIILRALGMHFWAQTSNLNLVTPKSFLRLFPSTATVHLHKHRLFGWSSNLIGYGQSNNYVSKQSIKIPSEL